MRNETETMSAEGTKKITLATVKSFINKNRANLFIRAMSQFDGMVDCVMPCDGGYVNAILLDYQRPDNLGIGGVHFVGGSRNSFSAFAEDGFSGFEVLNCCGKFRVAVKNEGGAS